MKSNVYNWDLTVMQLADFGFSESIVNISKPKVKINNQNIHKIKEIETSRIIGIRDIIINGDTTILKNGDEKIILKRNKEDKFNIEYAFLYGYFLKNTKLSKNQANKFLKELREIVEEEPIDKK